MSIIETHNLTRSYNNVTAVDNVSLHVEQGGIFGLIGPNGAGKTSIVRMLTTLLNPTRGTAQVNGFDILTQMRQVRQSIGYVPQDAQADEALTGREHLILQGRLYGMPASAIARRADEVFELVDLQAVADKRALEYSGGMRKLLDVAVGLLHAPKVLFLDEPTSGIDVNHRQRILAYLRTLPTQGTTIFLTTHLLEEIDQLADKVALIDKGKIITSGSPVELKQHVGSSVLNIIFARVDERGMHSVAECFRQLPALNRMIIDGDRLKLFIDQRDDMLGIVKQRLHTLNMPVASVTEAQPTLDDVFFYHIRPEEH